MSQRAVVPARRTGLFVLDGVVVALFLANAVVVAPVLSAGFRSDPAGILFVLLTPTSSIVGACTAVLAGCWWRCGRSGRGWTGAVVSGVVGFVYGCVAALYLVGMVLGHLMRDWQF